MDSSNNNQSNTDVVIVFAYRTPIGSFNGSLSSFKAHELGAILINHIHNMCKDAIPDEVIIGQALTAGQGQNPARQALINTKLPNTICATTVNMLCGSGLKSCVLGYQSIKSGDSKIIICGGQENMSQAPHCINLRSGRKMGDAAMVDTLICDGLTDAFDKIHMGLTAEHVAKTYNISRKEQDEFSFESQQKYKIALENNYFQTEVVPISIKVKNTDTIINKDEFPRIDTTIEGLSKLRPCFKTESEGGTITAGNASGINDGAAMLMLMNIVESKRLNLKPLVKIISWAQSACEPILMGVCPIKAIHSCVNKIGLTLNDVDLFELNEAFASQSVAIIKTLGLDKTKVNINGGAIALGHPIGCSGARILVTLIHSLIRTNKKRGLAALCIGGGMSIAICVERI